jgi:hypothetical protein
MNETRVQAARDVRRLARSIRRRLLYVENLRQSQREHRQLAYDATQTLRERAADLEFSERLGDLADRELAHVRRERVEAETAQAIVDAPAGSIFSAEDGVTWIEHDAMRIDQDVRAARAMKAMAGRFSVDVVADLVSRLNITLRPDQKPLDAVEEALDIPVGQGLFGERIRVANEAIDKRT